MKEGVDEEILLIRLDNVYIIIPTSIYRITSMVILNIIDQATPLKQIGLRRSLKGYIMDADCFCICVVYASYL